MTQKIICKKDNTTVLFLETGDLYEIDSHGIMINQLNGNYLDGSLNQLYLRLFTEEGIQVTPMIGSNAPSKFSFQNQQLTWSGTFHSISYQVDFMLAKEDSWFWRVQLSGSGKADVIYGQDIGNAAKGSVQSNEAYVSQYVDHHVTRNDGQIIVSSRQNQPQNGKFPLVEQGSLQPLRSFSTDGYQFFGRSYKETNFPIGLTQQELANEVYQYEFAYIALQTESYDLSLKKIELVFYGAVKGNQAIAVTKPAFSQQIMKERYEALSFSGQALAKVFEKKLGQPIVGLDLSDAQLKEFFPKQLQVEKVAGKTYSFFTEEYQHVVVKEKETAMERAHGHVLLSGCDLTIEQPLMSTTVYMYGIFNSQIVLGNTTMNKLMSNSRNALNILKQSGQRLYLKIDEQWRLLTLPSAFQMGLNSATWYYRLADDLLTVTTYSLTENREIRLEVASKKGHQYTWAISNQLLMGPSDTESRAVLDKNGSTVSVRSEQTSPVAAAYPELVYHMHLDCPFEMTTEQLFFNEAPSADLTVFVIDKQEKFTLSIQGSLTNAAYLSADTDIQQANERYLTFINELVHQFKLKHPTAEVESMNLLTRWYTQNMLVHYLSPHGLEQYGGAAWGTRDVSQGPTEFFLAVNRPEVVASIIQHVYENQFSDDGNWPQWFMFDRYEQQKADESHGDVIVWPMKVVADYLEKTGDFTILDQKIAYTDRQSFTKSREKPALYEHLKKEIQYIENNFLPETFLSCYGDGDWDDTLQPHDGKLKKYMASSWTVALTYQVLQKLAHLLADYDLAYAKHLNELAAGIKKDFKHYMLSTDTLPGFVYLENPRQLELIIHPQDQKTGIQYRLLPMTQSMLAELLSKEQASFHLDIIKKQLQYPDGVRLMNRPATYQGGVSRYFKRAEQAANLGREIGLQYVHAHIRFAEAMAKIGEPEETWQALSIINPIQIQKRVPNAEIRQANVYFSSSDGDFKTRYEAQENFGKLKDGSVGVKGGWRLYSSGPGIYFNQLLSSVLGIREMHDQVIFDPVLPKALDGLSLEYELFKHPVEIIFHLDTNKEQVLLNGEELAYTVEKNPYRTGGLQIEKAEIAAKLKTKNRIDIYR